MHLAGRNPVTMAGLVQLDWSEADGLDSWPRLGVNRNALLDRVQRDWALPLIAIAS